MNRIYSDHSQHTLITSIEMLMKQRIPQEGTQRPPPPPPHPTPLTLRAVNCRRIAERNNISQRSNTTFISKYKLKSKFKEIHTM
jgi:hypothetical protein